MIKVCGELFKNDFYSATYSSMDYSQEVKAILRLICINPFHNRSKQVVCLLWRFYCNWRDVDEVQCGGKRAAPTYLPTYLPTVRFPYQHNSLLEQYAYYLEVRIFGIAIEIIKQEHKRPNSSKKMLHADDR